MNDVNLAQIKAQVLDRANMTDSGFIDDTQLTAYINAALGELYDIMVAAFADYFVTTATIDISTDQEIADLPADFFKCVKLTVDGVVMRRFHLEDIGATEGDTKYRIMGDHIYFRPVVSAAAVVEIWYIPALVKLADAADVISWNPPISWEEYVVLAAAIRCLLKEESDASGLMALKAERKQQIIEMASERDQGEPATIKDVYMDDYSTLYGLDGI